MTILAKVENFSVDPGSDVNGAINTYAFTIRTKVPILEGDVFRFTFPSEIVLPSDTKDLNIASIVREVNDVEVSDDLDVEIAGNTVFVKFSKVADSTGTYRWTLDNIRNPPSTKPSSSFKNIISEDKDNYGV